MDTGWSPRPFFLVCINLFTKEHSPSGNWPSLRCVLHPLALTSAVHCVIITLFPQWLGHGDLALFLGVGAENFFQSLFFSLFWGAFLTATSLDLYSFIVGDKPERPWLWCFIAIVRAPLLALLFAALFIIGDFLRS